MESKGFVLLAFNNSTTDYVAIASTLRDSIHRVMPDAKVSLITDSDTSDSRYDKIIRVIDIDKTDWKLANDWMVYQHSPYDRTIKLEVDMYITRNLDHWWNILSDRDLNICSTIRDYKGEICTDPYYRAVITNNKLPDVYNAITYFRKSELAKQFYDYVRDIFENPEEYQRLAPANVEDRITTDVVYAIAAKIIGVEHCTMPTFTDFSMTHMKRDVNALKTDKWHKQLTYEIYPHVFRIATYPQMYPLHYHNKEFYQIIDREFDNG